MTALAAGTMATAVRLAAAGDQAAFARIVAAYHADMVRVAYGICGDSGLAQDAAQSAWMICWRKLGSVREPEHLRSWLVAIAANEARHLVRRRSHVVELTVDLPERPVADPADELPRVDLVNALNTLKPEERELVALRYGAELDSTEIGERLGLSASGVRNRLLRIMSRLRKELDDDAG